MQSATAHTAISYWMLEPIGIVTFSAPCWVRMNYEHKYQV